MQEIKKPSIVIASILKPANDTRMFEKMAKSLIATGKWDVTIIGYGNTFDLGEINMHSLGEFKRISFDRILAHLKALKFITRVKPKILIITTHELLNVAVTYKFFYGCKIYYDIQENYLLNLTSTSTFPPLIKYGIAYWVRFKEWLSKPFIHHYFLAEKSYVSELSFIGKKFSVIENRCWLPENFHRKSGTSGKLKILFTGTIDDSTGIWESIELCRKMFLLNDKVELRIIGYCAIECTRKLLLKEIQNHPFISFVGLDKLVSHEIILEEISGASAGIVYYPPSKHNKDRIPTKVYEYLACQLPVILDASASWKDLVISNQAGIAVNFQNSDAVLLLKRLQESTFYTKPVAESLWNSVEQAFLSSF